MFGEGVMQAEGNNGEKLRRFTKPQSLAGVGWAWLLLCPSSRGG